MGCTLMRVWNVRLGTGKAPDRFKDFQEFSDWRLLLGLKGDIHLVLYGRWWTRVTPDELDNVVINFSTNVSRPLVEIVA